MVLGDGRRIVSGNRLEEDDEILPEVSFAYSKNKAPREASFYFLFRQKCEHGYFIEGG